MTRPTAGGYPRVRQTMLTWERLRLSGRVNRSALMAISGIRFRPNLAFSEVSLVGHDRYRSGFAMHPTRLCVPETPWILCLNGVQTYSLARIGWLKLAW